MRKLFALAIIAVAASGQQNLSPAVLVYVEGSTVSSFSGAGGAYGGAIGGTTEPQTIEVMKQLRRFCRGTQNLQVTANRDAADYLILHERQAGGAWGGNRNNIAVFGKDDLLIYADGATKLDNAVKDLCQTSTLIAR